MGEKFDRFAGYETYPLGYLVCQDPARDWSKILESMRALEKRVSEQKNCAVVTACEGTQHGQPHAISHLVMKDGELLCPICGKAPFAHLNSAEG